MQGPGVWSGGQRLFLRRGALETDGSDARWCDCTLCPRAARSQTVMVTLCVHYCDLKEREEYKTPNQAAFAGGSRAPWCRRGDPRTCPSRQRWTVPKQVGPATALCLRTLEQKSPGDSAGNDAPHPRPGAHLISCQRLCSWW